MSVRPFLRCVDEVIGKEPLSRHKKALFVFHDQLNLDAFPAWVREEKPLLIFVEAREKGMELPHHAVKAIYILSAMRHAALEWYAQGFPVRYHSTNGHFDDGLRDLMQESPDTEIVWMEPSEWDSRERFRVLQEEMELAGGSHTGRGFQVLPNGFFFADPEEWKDQIRPGFRMEHFYRAMRKETGYLMDGAEPMGGEWNYDKENRKKIPATLPIPPRTQFEPDEITLEVAEMVRAYFPDSFGYEHLFGAVLRSFPFGVTREQALEHLDEFLEQRLDLFGPYEDALKTGEDTLFHSVLSVYLNNGLLHPREVCEKALGRFDEGHARLESVEGFIRQILGWREFIRIYYEAMMPKIREANHFGFERGLPALYWSGNTEMHCLRESVRPVLEMAYSHHIQRLMILSNFSNLTETDPRELNRWFHLAYADAYEWVELPNVLGMSTFADGGILASKPYVSGGNYINKMSDYCRSCRYDVKQKTGEGACPFNVLYWNFVDRQRETYNQSGRVNFMVSMFDKKPEEEKQAIREEAERFISAIHRLEPCARAEE